MYSENGKGFDLNKKTETKGTLMTEKETEALVDNLFDAMEATHERDIHEKAKANKKRKFATA